MTPARASHHLPRAWPALALVVGSLAVGCHTRAGESSSGQPPAHATSAAQPPAQASANPASSGTRQFRLVESGGIGFDDLVFSPELHAVLAPAGGTGCVDLFDSASLEKRPLCGVSAGGDYAGGHGEGTTSADYGGGFLFAIDRTSQSVKVVDPKKPLVIASSRLSGGPDYVRWVESRREIWVTEPDQEQIEVFSVSAELPPKLARAATIAVKGGPESLVIDDAKNRAFTHLWAGRTVSIDIATRARGAGFPNGCRGSRGIALDSSRGLLFVGCAEGKAVVLDVDHGGKIAGTEPVPSGVDIVSVNPQLRHFYVPSASDGSVTVLGVASSGALQRLGTFRATKGTHCAASDDHGRVWVCAPDEGSVMVFDDTFPASGG